ncbi:iron(III)-siderophore ABC transporter permease 1 [Thermococcus cleftensis]|uniref:Iron(III)-siderophore ABC transporter permease 1 n=1 Tax=Thermococcus cleftensis (strain DSM 27260 / KACC 17922 / CL1) TaxID=163003 RepID=I3ZUQ5_THECF|nr:MULTISPECIES: iron ABC transporter permease [Thermococcus]AFL95439.1 iron(III)-siderophore ABC transporter permease 1 [Thermococcus cleftensis]NJE04043.1 iron ABC transporter permease [Thermococcus sp. MV11]
MDYRDYVARRVFMGFLLLLSIVLVSLHSLSHGAYHLTVGEVVDALLGGGTDSTRLIVWNIRLPRIVAGLLVGASLAIAGAVMQGFLRNPLATPFTMGVSHGAMFGASLAILLGAGYAESSGRISLDNPYAVVLFAFIGAISATAVILTLARLRGLSPEAIILAGVAMSSLFVAMTTLVQYFADELQLAAMVYWSFGDLGRATWREDAIMFLTFAPVFTYFLLRRWDLNASAVGDEVAKSVGVEVERIRLVSTFLAALITAVSVAFVGVIGFVGLIAPHAVRLIAGGDYRFLIPLSALTGALLLVTADTLARLIISPAVLPVGIVTSFLGAPAFIYLLVRMEGRR